MTFHLLLTNIFLKPHFFFVLLKTTRYNDDDKNKNKNKFMQIQLQHKYNHHILKKKKKKKGESQKKNEINQVNLTKKTIQSPIN